MLLKQFVAAFMIVIFLTQTFSNAIIVADYYLNTNSFATNCENKNKPQLHCNGQCQMVKQMEKEDNSSKAFSNSSKEKNELQFFCNDAFTTEIYFPIILTNYPNNAISFYMQQCIKSVFHPPSAA